ncbi:MAG: UbiA family prenyltransferase, partial [Polyangiales bacterium]
MPTDSTPAETKGPLCVDLDGTLVATDTTVESLLGVLKKPWKVPGALGALATGRPQLKRYLVENAPVDAASLPYRDAVLDEINEARAAGRRVLLVTASDQATADAVAEYLGVFDEAIGSDGKSNLKAQRKADYLKGRFGEGGFEYLGDSSADLPVWKAANEASMVVPSARTQRAAEQLVPTSSVLVERPEKLRAVVKELRPHQWAKNILLFVPLYFSHQYTDLDLVFTAFMAFLSFSFCASAIYVLNDLVDLPADRQHRSKRNRPLASGALSLGDGFALFGIALAVSIVLAVLFVGPRFVLVLLGYVALTTAYSFSLKQMMIVDVLTLASLFTYRVVAGGVAVDVKLSPWL